MKRSGMIQTKKEKIKEAKISEEVETRKHLVDTMGERGNISPQKIAQHGEKDVESVERRTTLQRFTYIIEEEAIGRRSDWWHLY